MIKNIFLLALAMACAQFPKEAKVKHIPVQNEKEATFVIQNQINFLKSIFQQSTEPYYKIQKWHPVCLAANKVGEQKNLRSVSMLWLKDGNPGHCAFSETAVKSFVIYQYCPKTSEVLEIKIPMDTHPEYKDKNLCL